MPDYSRFDRDPEALAWARASVQRLWDRMDRFAREAAARGSGTHEWRFVANVLKRDLIGGSGCVYGAFDERLPALAARIEPEESQESAGEDGMR